MKIKLDIPFSNDFKTGYLGVNKEPRRVLTLIRKDGSKTSISYARYLYSCKLGKYIDSYFEVDHIDDNQMNDDINNLQLLSKANNNKKKTIKTKKINFVCPICRKEFQLCKRRAYKKNNPCCSRVCGGKKSHLNIYKNINAIQSSTEAG